MNHHRLSRTVVTMERLLEVFATGTIRGIMQKAGLNSIPGERRTQHYFLMVFSISSCILSGQMT